MTTTSVAALHFHRHWQRAPDCFDLGGYLLAMLDKSRFAYRLHAIGEVFLTVFRVLGKFFKLLNTDLIYLINSFFAAAGYNLYLSIRSALP